MSETRADAGTQTSVSSSGMLGLIGLVFAVLFILGFVGTAQTLNDVVDDASVPDYIAAGGQSATYAVVTAVCWVGAALLSRADR